MLGDPVGRVTREVEVSAPQGGRTVGYAAVVFDLFGTLVPNYNVAVYHDLERRIAVRLGLTQAELHTRWSETFTARSTGVYPTLADNFAAVCRTGSRPPDAT